MLGIFGMLLAVLGAFLLISVVGALIMTLIGVAYQRKKLDKEPVVTVDASVISKREKPIYRRENSSAKNNMIVRIIYYATFRTEEEKEIELSVTKEEWDLLAEGTRESLPIRETGIRNLRKTEKESLSRRLLDEIES